MYSFTGRTAERKHSARGKDAFKTLRIRMLLNNDQRVAKLLEKQRKQKKISCISGLKKDQGPRTFAIPSRKSLGIFGIFVKF